MSREAQKERNRAKRMAREIRSSSLIEGRRLLAMPRSERIEVMQKRGRSEEVNGYEINMSYIPHESRMLALIVKQWKKEEEQCIAT